MPMIVAAEWGGGQVFLSMLWLSLFVIWVWLVISVFVDVFRSPDLGGWAKALWVLFVIAAPYLGVLVYLIARGSQMQPIIVRFGLPTADNSASLLPPVLTHEQVEALALVAERRDQGLITAAEYVAQRQEILG
jgi:hypothetical protein